MKITATQLIIGTILILLNAPLHSAAQNFGLYNLDVTPFQNQDKGNDFVDCSSGKTGDAFWALKCTRANGIENVIHKSVNSSRGLKTKVAAQMAAQSPRRGQGHRKGSVGAYNYQTSDAHLQWAADRRERLREQQRRAEERKLEEERRRRIEDDNRQASVNAATHARLQEETNRAMERDHWHANQGAQLAVQRAREAHKIQGPQFSGRKTRMNNTEKAKMMLKSNKPRVSPVKQSLRKQLHPVRRTRSYNAAQSAALKAAMEKKAELAAKSLAMAKNHAEAISKAKANQRVELERKYAEDRRIVAAGRSGTRMTLSKNATSSLGQDWKTTPLTTPRIPERRKMTPEELHRLKVIEFIDKRPLTPEEARYYENLTL